MLHTVRNLSEFIFQDVSFLLHFRQNSTLPEDFNAEQSFMNLKTKVYWKSGIIHGKLANVTYTEQNLHEELPPTGEGLTYGTALLYLPGLQHNFLWQLVHSPN